MIRLALFASGTGSNVYNIIQYFKDREDVEVVSVLSNKESAGALNHAKNAGIDTLVFNKQDFSASDNVLNYLKSKKVDFVVLAGFLWKIPSSMVTEFESKIINVHPALLPKYGGKGMYGANVHKAVLESGDQESGITIHKVNENYDEGATIAQYTCGIDQGETMVSLTAKIHELEKEYFPRTIDNYIHK